MSSRLFSDSRCPSSAIIWIRCATHSWQALMASGTERVAASFAANPVHSSISDCKRESQSRPICSYVSRTALCALSIASVGSRPKAKRDGGPDLLAVEPVAFVDLFSMILPTIFQRRAPRAKRLPEEACGRRREIVGRGANTPVVKFHRCRTGRPPARPIDQVDTRFTGGMAHEPLRIDGLSSLGQYMRNIRMNFPAGAGSQFDSRATPGESLWM